MANEVNKNKNLELQKYMMILKACKNLGGDIKLYQQLKFNIPQLIQILKGLESKVDVNYYLDPSYNWHQMEILRKGLNAGISLKVWIDNGFNWQQIEQIYLGYTADLPIERYGLLDYSSDQMEQLRLGLLEDLDISFYEDSDFSAQQMLEIRKGLQKHLDVAQYTKKEYDSIMMREIRRALQDKFNISKYLEKGYSSKVLRQLRKSEEWGYDILPFVNAGYNADQIEEIGLCLQQNIKIQPYLTLRTNWKQIREIRLGFESGVDAASYANMNFSAEQMEQIRLGLEEKLDVAVYATPGISAEAMKATREKLLFAKDSSNLVNDMLSLSENEIMASIEAELEVHQKEAKTDEITKEKSDEIPVLPPVTKATSVSISNDLMSASLYLAPPVKEPYTIETLVKLLGEQNIKQGINLAILQRILNKELYNEEIVIARGKEAINGSDGEFTFHFRTEQADHKPTILPDGSVDYFNNSAFEFAKEGQLLAEYTPATLGEYGYTVTGKLIIPKRGKDLPVLRGRGFAMSEDKKQYTATSSGQIEYNNNKLNIINCLTINHDLDISIGNINFDGNVEIMGNIIPNMMIHATGTVKVNGYVESASIYAGQDVVLSKGIQGGGVSYIQAGGDVFAPFFESTTIKCEGSLNANHILNCDVTANDSVLLSGKRGLILGGTTKALRYIDATTSGNKAELPTKLILGVDADVIKSYGETMQSISKVKIEISALQKNLVIFEEQSQTEHYTYKMLQKSIKLKEEDLQNLTKQLNEYNRIIELSSSASANFMGNVYPGTSISINGENHQVKEEQHQVTFRLRDRKIIMEEYTSPKDTK